MKFFCGLSGAKALSVPDVVCAALHIIRKHRHTKLWGKQLPPTEGKNKPSMKIMVIQGNWDKCTALIFRVEG
jgi:hypothetical protein